MLMIMNNPLVILRCLLCTAAGVAFSAEAPAGQSAIIQGERHFSVTVSPDRVLERNFLGFGVEWEYEGDHPENHVANPIWTNRWPEMVRRIDYMCPAILRVMHDARMYTRLEQGRFIPDYRSSRMQTMYRILDYAHSRNIPVVFGEWWLHETYREQMVGIGDPRWSDELIVPFLRYLRENCGYTNMVYFNLMNEPQGLQKSPGVGMDFVTWRTSILNLHAALKRNNLADSINIVGSDGPGDWSQWIGKIAEDAGLRDSIGAYEYHLYAHLDTDKWLPSLLEGKLGREELLPRRQHVNAHDPRGASKPFFMGEAGISDGAINDQQTNRYSFVYGVWMTDYAIQSICAGQAGLIAWDMDDAMHTWGSYGQLGLKGWGFWNSLGGTSGYPQDDFALRPWFYTWSLLCRLFPRGSQTLAVDGACDDACRVAAARLPGGKGLSLALVNESSTACTVALALPPIEKEKLYEYRYFASDRPADQDGFPVPTGVRDHPDGSTVLSVRLPSQGSVFLTTQNPGLAPVMTKQSKP